MPAPSNTSFSLATAIAVPYDGTQDFVFSGTKYTLYYSITADRDGVLAVFPFANHDAGDFSSEVDVYQGSLPTPTYTGESTFDEPLILPCHTGDVFYLKCRPFGLVTASSTVLRLKVDYVANAPIANGDIVVPGDFQFNATRSTPLSVIAAATGKVLAYTIDMPTGEFCDNIQSSGIALFEDNINHNHKLYQCNADGTFTLLATITPPVTWVSKGLVYSNNVDRFYVGYKQTTPTAHKVITVDAAGAIGATTWEIPNASSATVIDAIAVNPGGTILYYAIRNAKTIKQWDLGTNSALADFATLPGTADTTHVSGKAIQVLSDGSVLVTYLDTIASVLTAMLRKYAADGTLAYTVSLGSSSAEDNCISLDFQTDATIWAFVRKSFADEADYGKNQLLQIRTSDGTILQTRTSLMFIADYGQMVVPTDPPPDYYGYAESCGMFIFSSGVTVVDVGTIGPYVWIHWPRRVA